MKHTLFSKTVITKIMCVLAMFPPITYVGLTAAPPMPYSPVVDYALVHSSEYSQELAQSVNWLEVSHSTIQRDIRSLDHPDTSWTIPRLRDCEEHQ